MTRERYDRQIHFSGIGPEGQKRVQRGQVTIIGLGALGSNIASLLARAGVGKLRLVDGDRVELSNLQRQDLYDEADARASRLKVEAARDRLAAINSEVAVQICPVMLEPGNARELIAGSDIVLDGTDNFQARYTINRACLQEGIPWVYGGVAASFGMTATIIPERSGCLRCLFGEEPGSALTAQTSGIIGSIVRVIAALEVSEALKWLVGADELLNRWLLMVDVWWNEFSRVDFGPVPDCPDCGGAAGGRGYR
ncbi:MAG: ThiF family adenylyltransferase [Bacillota bacterium]